MATIGSTKSLFEDFYREKPKMIGSFSEFGLIAYVTKRDKIKKQMMEKTYKAFMFGYVDNHIRDTYKLYKPDTKRVIMRRDVKCEEWNMTYPAETMKMFLDSHKQDLVPGIEEYNITM